jgi:hypothetical protein
VAGRSDFRLALWESLGSARSLGGPAAPVDFGRLAKGAGSNLRSLPLPINC